MYLSLSVHLVLSFSLCLSLSPFYTFCPHPPSLSLCFISQSLCMYQDLHVSRSRSLCVCRSLFVSLSFSLSVSFPQLYVFLGQCVSVNSHDHMHMILYRYHKRSLEKCCVDEGSHPPHKGRCPSSRAYECLLKFYNGHCPSPNGTTLIMDHAHVVVTEFQVRPWPPGAISAPVQYNLGTPFLPFRTPFTMVLIWYGSILG